MTFSAPRSDVRAVVGTAAQAGQYTWPCLFFLFRSAVSALVAQCISIYSSFSKLYYRSSMCCDFLANIWTSSEKYMHLASMSITAFLATLFGLFDNQCSTVLTILGLNVICGPCLLLCEWMRGCTRWIKPLSCLKVFKHSFLGVGGNKSRGSVADESIWMYCGWRRKIDLYLTIFFKILAKTK